ncbi:MAG: tyrosine-type recombinase/integrase [Pseudomonadales bacterium]|nr:tyrosine-type recombinase/integrase [Pseudomonadales bacterium]
MALSHTAVLNAKPKQKIYKLFDGGGLYLQVKPTGYRCWKYDYRLNGSRGTYTIGQYPDISLKQARERHREARECIAIGTHPKTLKDLERVEYDLNNKRFSHYANQWLDKQNMAESTFSDLKQRVEKNLIPYLDKKKVNEFTTADLLKITLKISERGAKETAQRMANVLRRIYNDILILGIVENNPAQGLAELLPKPDARLKGNFGHITSTDELKVLLQQIDKPSIRQDYSTTQALKLMPLVFLRPKNIRFLKWQYINFEEKMISLPGTELKTGKPLAVPLSRQSISILKEMEQLTGNGEYVFVSSRSKKGTPISENTTTQALRRIINPSTGEPFGTGYMTSHGFRHTASTLLNELGFDPDIIELQLAHINKDRMRATYNKAQWMEKRITMMQSWADYLDGLKSSVSNIIPLNKANHTRNGI